MVMPALAVYELLSCVKYCPVLLNKARITLLRIELTYAQRIVEFVCTFLYVRVHCNR